MPSLERTLVRQFEMPGETDRVSLDRMRETVLSASGGSELPLPEPQAVRVRARTNAVINEMIFLVFIVFYSF